MSWLVRLIGWWLAAGHRTTDAERAELVARVPWENHP